MDTCLKHLAEIDSASDPDQEYIHFMGSETLSSICYIIFDKSNIPFYSTSNGYNNKNQIVRKDRLKVDYSNMGI